MCLMMAQTFFTYTYKRHRCLNYISCSTEVEYISIYERRGQRGRPRGSKYTDEQKQGNLRIAALEHYYNKYEYCTLQQQLSKNNARHIKRPKKLTLII